MSAPNDGGPAFPTVSASVHLPHHGMTLRDYFAGEALKALLSMQITHTRIAEGGFTPMETAGCCYQWSDMMLAARERKEVKP